MCKLDFVQKSYINKSTNSIKDLWLWLVPFLNKPSEEESEESSSGEVEIEQEVSSDPEDPRELHPGALLYRSSRLHNLPLMAEALAHGADVHSASEEEEGKTPLIQAVIGVRHCICTNQIITDWASDNVTSRPCCNLYLSLR